jgi:hypothetical protein
MSGFDRAGFAVGSNSALIACSSCDRPRCRRLLEREVAGHDRRGVGRPYQRDAGEAQRDHHDERDEQYDAALPAGSRGARERVGGKGRREAHGAFQSALRSGTTVSSTL